MFIPPRTAFSVLSLSTRLLIGASFLSAGSVFAMDTQEASNNDTQRSKVIPRATASAKGKEEVEEPAAESSERPTSKAEPASADSHNAPILDIVMNYLRSFGNVYEEFLTEKPIAVTANPSEEATEEWEASPRFLDIFLMRLSMTDNRHKTGDFFGLEETVFATFAKLISLVDTSPASERYAVFRYLVDLNGNQLTALHDRVEDNPEILYKIKQTVPGLRLYSPEDILSEAFASDFLKPLTAVSLTFHDASRRQNIREGIELIHARRTKSKGKRTLSFYVGSTAKYETLFHTIAKVEGVSPESVRLINVDSWGEHHEPVSFDADWVSSQYCQIGGKGSDSALFTTPKDTDYARRILYTIDGEEPTPVEAHAVLFSPDDADSKRDTIRFGADTARTLIASCYYNAPLQHFMSNLDTESYPYVDTVCLECDQFGLGLASAMAKDPRQHLDETPSSLMDRISGYFKEYAEKQEWGRVVNFILRDSTTGLAVDMFRYHPEGTIEGIVSSGATTEFLSEEATPILPLGSYHVRNIEELSGRINSAIIKFADEEFNFYYGLHESSKSIFERVAVMCGVEPQNLRICYGGLGYSITFPSYTEATELRAVHTVGANSSFNWFTTRRPPLLDDGSHELDSNNPDITTLLPELTRVKTKKGNAFYGSSGSIPPVSQIILPENETLEEIIITMYDPKDLFNALSRFHRAHYPNVTRIFLDTDLSGKYHDRDYHTAWLRDAKEKNGWGTGTVFVVRDTKSGIAAEIL
jgi:hypothetical protein